MSEEGGNAIPARADLSDALSANPPDDLPEGGLLVGWVIVTEWQTPDGRLWLSRLDGKATDHEHGLPPWRRQGYLHNALHTTGWDDDPPDEKPTDE